MIRIFVPITGARETRRALRRAVDIAGELNAKLYVIYVVDTASVAKLERFKIFVQDESQEFLEGLKKDAERYMNYARKLAEKKGVDIETVTLEGRVFEEFTDFVEESGRGFVVIGKRNTDSFDSETFGKLEKRLILRTDFDIIIAGEE